MQIHHLLARLLELTEAHDTIETARAAGAEAIWCAGGVAAIFGATSPLTQVVGAGMQGPVSNAEVEQLEAFFRAHGTDILLDLCPYADFTLWELVRDRGYRFLEFKNVLVREIGEQGNLLPLPPGMEVRMIRPDEKELFGLTVSRGFFGRDDLNEEELKIAGIVASHFHGFMAFVGGEPAGCGSVSIQNEVASLVGDGTLVRYRCQGVQNALVQARLRYAASQGAKLATATVFPGSGSQRNYERNGFQVAYTKIGMGLKLC